MNRIHRILLAGALAAAVAVPAVAQQQFSDNTTMLKAVRERDGATVERLLADPSSNAVNARDTSTGEGLLHIVVRRRDIDWLAFLLGRRARPDMQSNDGSAPLHLAASIGWVEGAQQLLARRASVDIVNNRGETPLILAVQGRQLDIIPLLLQQGANPAHTDSVAGYSALDYARQDRRDPTIARLLESAPARRQSQQPIYGPTAQ
ncbi:ankyrin repeat domain-containing protein [Sphingosinicella sp. YJ22]|uniref:ankyrin repeat domain-containing protein n=1 Tax=Sphingosinicella sp. YJ22 TaxID=1104780 RepID=UPI00140BE87E|nr:ankyrin repeat domain-containing protein [Sphingosinicella sp. YJ22]